MEIDVFNEDNLENVLVSQNSDLRYPHNHIPHLLTVMASMQDDNNSNYSFSDDDEEDNDGIDYITTLPIDILTTIMTKLDIGSLYSISLVSQLFNELSNDFEIWKPKCRLNNMKSNYLEKITLLNPQTTSSEKQSFNQLKSSLMTTRECRFYTDELSPYSEDVKSWKKLYFELGSIVLNSSYDLISEAIEASSCDVETQGIENTLLPNKKFWSSKGSNDMSSSEYLIYKLEQPVCIVSSVQIHVYKAFFQPSSPIYSPQTIRISVGFTPNNMHFTSEEFLVEHTDEPQTFYLDPRLVIGGYIRIDLIGHHQVQTSDGLFYTVLRYICVDGRSIGCIENKQELCLSMLKFASKYINIHPTLEYNNNNNIDNNNNNNNSFNQLLSHYKSQMAPKIDKFKVYNNVMNSILQDIVEGNCKQAALNAINNNMRSTKIFNLFLRTSDVAISEYYIRLVDSGNKFSQDETLFFTKETFETCNISLFTKFFTMDLIYVSEALGDYLLYNGYALMAAEVFNRSLIPDKVIQSLFISGSHIDTIHLIETIQNEQRFNLSHLIKLFKSYSLYQAYLFTITVLENLENIITQEEIRSLFSLKSNNLEDILIELKELIRSQVDQKPSVNKRTYSPLNHFFTISKQNLKSRFF